MLGPVEVLTDSGAQVPLGSGRERLVLAMLVLGADRLVPTERLIDVLWTEPPPTAKQQLQNLIAGLRRRLATHDRDLVATRPFGYQLRMGGHRLDVVEFRRLVGDARGRVEADDPDGAAHTLERALGIWRGSPLSDAAPASPDTEVSTLVQSLHDERVGAVDLLVESLAAAGLHDRVLAATASQLHHDPWNERLHAHRLRALAATGRRSEAGEEYRRLRRTFRDELGVEPGAALAGLNVEILEGRSVAMPPPLVVARTRPVPRELPALAWTLVGRDDLLAALVGHLGVMTSPGSTAPADPSDRSDRSDHFGGTDSSRPGPPEQAPEQAPEQTPGGRPCVVVLVGVGGVGKTALAVAAGHALGDAYPDGTLHAALGHGPRGSADVHDVAARFLRALGVDQAAIPADPDERISLYRSTIDRKRLLVVLDDAVSEAQVRRLLPTGPGSAAIVTSRSKLAGLVGVRRHTVPPLSPEDAAGLIVELAGPDRPAGTASGEKPGERAGEGPSGVTRAGTVVDEISALCGYLPLALCVAGAKLATNADLDLDELRDRLSGEHARLDELSVGDIDVRASIGASVGDLAAPAATLFARLGVTSGEWPEWVPRLLMTEGVSRGEARQALDQLVDRHLVEPSGRDAAGQARFRMHSLVVELSRERLLATEGPAARDDLVLRLDITWLDLAVVAEAHLGDHDPAATTTRHEDARQPLTSAPSRAPIDWFEAERINLTAAVLGALALEERELAARLALALRTFLTVRAYDDERERVLRLALDDYPETCDQGLLAQLLGALFGVLAQERRFAELPEVASRRLETARALGDTALEQSALAQAGWAAMVLNRFDEALEAYAAVAVLAKQRGDEPGRAAADGQRGVVLRNMGRPADGDPLLATMVEASRRRGSARRTCIWLVTRSEGLLDLGRTDAAEALLTEALAIAEGLRDELGAAHCRLALARAHLLRGSLARAEEGLQAARPQLDAHAVDGEDLDCLRLAVDLDSAAGRWPSADRRARRLVHARRAEGDELQLACDLARIARLARLGQHLDPADVPGGDPTRGEAEADEATAILRRLGLGPEALRLPPLPSGGPTARC